MEEKNPSATVLPLLILALALFSAGRDPAFERLWLDLKILTRTALAPPPHDFDALVVSVQDGATLLVHAGRGASPDARHRALPVRLAYIECPVYDEASSIRNQPFGREATEFTKRLALGATAKVEPLPGRSHTPLTARVRLPDGRSLNDELLRAGLAWCDSVSPSDPRMEALEQMAQCQRRGVWSTAPPTRVAIHPGDGPRGAAPRPNHSASRPGAFEPR